MLEPITVDIYCRSATDSQEGDNTLNKQEAACRQYCEEQGLRVSVIHREVAPGTLYRERPGLEAMRLRYRQGKIHGVVVYRLDRLARNQVHVAILLEEMEQHDIPLYIVLEELDNSSVGKLIRMSLARCAEAELEKGNDRLLNE